MHTANKRNENNTTATVPAKTICKLGLDAHAASITVARQLDGANPQRPQRFAVPKFLAWVEEQVKKGYQVGSCYEADPTGYWLHRKLEALGVTNYVVCPTQLDSRGKGVSNDSRDALELLVRLDRYVAGNRKAFSVVRVPTVAQEQKRALVRQRDQLRRKRLSFAAQGRMLLLSQGYRQGNSWWQASRWEKWHVPWPAWLVKQLEVFRRLIESVDQAVEQLAKQVEAAAPASLPVGMGRLTHEVIESEMKDFKNFQNRRQVGSYPGLTGGVSSSGEQRADLSITKAGNRRLSTCLIECAWRLVLQQPDYWLVKKWRGVLLNPKAHVRRRKQAIVAFARQLLVDLWKWKTGRTTPAALGWKMS
jgi:transposase